MLSRDRTPGRARSDRLVIVVAQLMQSATSRRERQREHEPVRAEPGALHQPILAP